MYHVAYLILIVAAVFITRFVTKLHYETRIDKLEMYRDEYVKIVALLKGKVGKEWKIKSAMLDRS